MSVDGRLLGPPRKDGPLLCATVRWLAERQALHLGERRWEHMHATVVAAGRVGGVSVQVNTYRKGDSKVDGVHYVGIISSLPAKLEVIPSVFKPKNGIFHEEVAEWSGRRELPAGLGCRLLAGLMGAVDLPVDLAAAILVDVAAGHAPEDDCVVSVQLVNAGLTVDQVVALPAMAEHIASTFGVAVSEALGHLTDIVQRSPEQAVAMIRGMK